MKERSWSWSILQLLVLVHALLADEAKVGDRKGVPATWEVIEAQLRQQCVNNFPLCKEILGYNEAPDRIPQFFSKLCDETQNYPPFTCPYYMSMHASRDELMYNQYCKAAIERNDKYAKACKTYVQLMVTQASPWISQQLLVPCTQAANGKACDQGMSALCTTKTYLCERVHEIFTKDVNVALAGSSEMCQKDGYSVKFYCDAIQSAVVETPNWMDQQCAPYRSAYQLCKGQWPPACEIYRTVCNNGKAKDCGDLRTQEAFCKELETLQGTQSAYDKHCTTEPANQRYCKGVLDDLNQDSEKFTRICTESCKKDSDKLCAYCQKLIEQDPRKLWAQCHDAELLRSPYCQRIIEYCTSYSTTEGCPQVLRENVLWGLEFGNTKDIAEIVEKLAKLCEKEPSEECKKGVENILNGQLGGNFPAIHSALCEKYKTACQNIIEGMFLGNKYHHIDKKKEIVHLDLSMKDKLDDITSSCDASTWSNFTSCQVVLDECINKKYNCPILQEKQKSTDDFNKFPSASPSEKKAMLEKYCAEDKINTPVCQAFLDKTAQLTPAQQNAVVPAICAENKVELCRALIDRIARKEDDAIGSLAKDQCVPWKKEDLFCTTLHEACRNITSPGCDALGKIECGAADPKQLKECLESLHKACDNSPQKGDPNYEQCKALSETIADNEKAAQTIAELCESPESRDKALCKSILDNAEKKGELEDIYKQICTKENMESQFCKMIQDRCRHSNSENCDEVREITNNVNFDPEACKTNSKKCRDAVAWHCIESPGSGGNKDGNEGKNNTNKGGVTEKPDDDGDNNDQPVPTVKSDKGKQTANVERPEPTKAPEPTEAADQADEPVDDGQDNKEDDNAEEGEHEDNAERFFFRRFLRDAGSNGQNKIRNKENCKKLFGNMPKDVAVDYHKLCVDLRNADEICEITGGKLNTDGTLYDAFLKHCSGAMAFGRGCKTLYDLCKKYHTDGSAGCDKLVSKYELEDALANATYADVNKTADALSTICAPGKDSEACKEYLSNNKTAGSLIIGGLQAVCSRKQTRDTCRNVLETLLKEKSPLLDKLGLMCIASQMPSVLCEELARLCKNYKDLPVCVDLLAEQKKKEDLEKISSDPAQATEMLKKYCTGPNRDPKMCALVKGRLLGNPDVVAAELDKICELDAQLCQLFTEEAIKANQTMIPILFKKYCVKDPHPQICKVIEEFCATSLSKECKETRNRVCVAIETIDKCIKAVNKECSFDYSTRTTAQIETCNDLTNQATDSKPKITKLQVVCEGNATACSGFVRGSLDSNTGYSVFETWCPKQDYGLLKCKTFREQCALRTEDVDCVRINALFAEFDPMACKDKDEKTCMDALTANCDPTVPSAEENERCDQLFANMGKDDALKMKNKCSSGNSPKTCARLTEKLKELGAVKDAWEDWCEGGKDKSSPQCKELQNACKDSSAEGCEFVNSAKTRPQRIGAIVGMILGALIMALGVVFWVILGVNRSKHDDEKERLRQAKKEEKKRKKMEKKMAKKNKKKKKKDEDSTTNTGTTTDGSTFGP